VCEKERHEPAGKKFFVVGEEEGGRRIQRNEATLTGRGSFFQEDGE